MSNEKERTEQCGSCSQHKMINHQAKKLEEANKRIMELQEQGIADVAIREKLLHENAELREALSLVDEFKSEVLSFCNNSDAYFDSLNPLLEWFNDNRQSLAKYSEKGDE